MTVKTDPFTLTPEQLERIAAQGGLPAVAQSMGISGIGTRTDLMRRIKAAQHRNEVLSRPRTIQTSIPDLIEQVTNIELVSGPSFTAWLGQQNTSWLQTASLTTILRSYIAFRTPQPGDAYYEGMS
jgi:hypothetical protein